TQSLVLDTRDLKISKIEALATDGKTTRLDYVLSPRDKQLGSKLTIAAPKHPTRVRIVYTTSPEASGLQWLTPAQTADRKAPFMFSQSESIHARSWVPLQDSPAIRFTYDAHVTAPKNIRVVMSALNDAKHPLDGLFDFSQPHPIPSYLLAIAAGDIAVQETGPRSAVYAEPSVVGKAAHEFEDTENLIAAASWRDIWLNEGITTYVQGRITEALYGKSLADEEALLSARALQKEIGKMPANSQKLAPDPRGVGADDSLSDVAYDKGSWFLRTLEQRYGREHFDAYLKSYFDHFAFRSITTEQMLAFLKPNLIEKYPGRMSWDEVKAWVYGEGIPKDAPLPDSPRFNAIDQERTEFLAGSLAAAKLDAKGWNTQEWMYFLDRLPDVAPLDKLQQLDAVWHLTGTPNAEIGMRWYSHAIAAGDKTVWPAAAEHMTRIGRLYLTTPLYTAFVKTP